MVEVSETGEGIKQYRLLVTQQAWGAEYSTRSVVGNTAMAAWRQMGSRCTGDGREGWGRAKRGKGFIRPSW